METVKFEKKKSTTFKCKRSLPLTPSQEFLKHKVSKASDKIKGDVQVSFQDYQYQLNSSRELYECHSDLVTLNKLNEKRYRMLILDYEDGEISYDQIMNSETI